MHPIRHTVRSLRRSPTLSTVAIVSVGLGTALCVLVAMVLRQSILLTPALSQADQIVQVIALGYDDCRECPDALSGNVVKRWSAHPLSSIASFGWYRDVELVVEEGTGATRINAAAIDGNFFATLGSGVAAGRLPDATELANGDPAAAVISQRLADRLAFPAPASAIGHQLTVSGRSVTVVGVLATGIELPATAELWINDRLLPIPGGGSAHVYTGLGRLRAGSTAAAARRELTDLGFDRADSGHIGAVPHVTILADGMRHTNGPALALLIAAAVATLVLATANLQSLLIVRAIDNSGATAIRMAMGATGRDLVRLLGLESGLLCGLGVLPALGAVVVGRALLAPYLAAEWYRPVALSFDVLSASALVAVPLLMAIIGLIAPAWHLSTVKLRDALQEESAGLSSSRRQVQLRMIFVVAQVAVALVLVVAAGLLIRAYSSLNRIDVGYDAQRIAVARLDLSGTPYDDWTRAEDWSTQVGSALDAKGAGASAYWVRTGPSGAVGPKETWTSIDGHAPPTGIHRLLDEYHVSNNFFSVFGLRAVRGRLFDSGDRAGSTPVVIVNEIAAKAWWPGEDPIGQRIKLGPEASPMPWLTVVGIIPSTERFDQSALWISSTRPDLKFALAFIPFEQSHLDRFGAPLPLREVSIGTTIIGTPPASIARLNASVLRLGGELPPPLVGTLYDLQHGSSNFPQLLIAKRALGGLAGLALLLAAIGLFGVISENTRARTAEIGIRRALGAAAGHISWLAARPALAALGYGLGAGSLIAVAFSRTLLYGFFGITSQNRYGLLLSVSPGDSVALTLSILVLLGTVIVALIGPVRRALAIEPMRALRHRK